MSAYATPGRPEDRAESDRLERAKRHRVQNDRGEWVPAIPLPYTGLRKECYCGAAYWTTAGYRGHYALAHILALAGDR